MPIQPTITASRAWIDPRSWIDARVLPKKRGRRFATRMPGCPGHVTSSRASSPPSGSIQVPARSPSRDASIRIDPSFFTIPAPPGLATPSPGTCQIHLALSLPLPWHRSLAGHPGGPGGGPAPGHAHQPRIAGCIGNGDCPRASDMPPAAAVAPPRAPGHGCRSRLAGWGMDGTRLPGKWAAVFIPEGRVQVDACFPQEKDRRATIARRNSTTGTNVAGSSRNFLDRSRVGSANR